MAVLRSFTCVVVVVLASLLSVASSHEGNGDGSACGSLLEGAAEGEACTERTECAEICCFCDGSDTGFRAQGCNLDESVCYGGDVLCQLALDDDPTLCPAGEGEGEGEP